MDSTVSFFFSTRGRGELVGNDKIVIELSLKRTKFERNAAEKRNEGEGEDWKYREL